MHSRETRCCLSGLMCSRQSVAHQGTPSSLGVRAAHAWLLPESAVIAAARCSCVSDMFECDCTSDWMAPRPPTGDGSALPSRGALHPSGRPDTTKVYTFANSFRDVGPQWTSLLGHFMAAGYTTAGQVRSHQTRFRVEDQNAWLQPTLKQNRDLAWRTRSASAHRRMSVGTGRP